MSYQITYSTTTVTLPAVHEIYYTGPESSPDTQKYEGGGSVGISRFLGAKTLTVIADLCGSGVSNSTLFSSYINVLVGFTGKTVTLTFPDSAFSGNWIMLTPTFTRVPEGKIIRYEAVLSFMQPTEIINNIA